MQEGKEEYPADSAEKIEPVSTPTGSRIMTHVKEIARVLIISILIVVPIRYFIAQPFVVRGASMEPNFSDREYLIVDEVSYAFRNPVRGEVVIFHYPRMTEQYLIKRIIGLPGERVTIKKGQVMIANASSPDGFILEESYLDPSQFLTGPDLSMQLGPNEYFVMGDNRNFSSDSRIWGGLDLTHIVGRAFIRAWPPDRVGIFEKSL